MARLLMQRALSPPITWQKSASNVSTDVLRETFETNLYAVVRLTQTLLPLLKKSQAGRIVNVSSILGSLGLHSEENSPIAAAKPFAYNASKAALNAFTVHLADEASLGVDGPSGGFFHENDRLPW